MSRLRLIDEVQLQRHHTLGVDFCSILTGSSGYNSLLPTIRTVATSAASPVGLVGSLLLVWVTVLRAALKPCLALVS